MTTQAPCEHTTEVLVVDDHDSIRKIMRLALEDAGYIVYEAPDGVQALDRLRNHPHDLVVLLDLNMPRLDGWGVLRVVEAETLLARRHSFLLLTAAGDALPPALVALLSDLHVPVVAKPSHLVRILDAVAGAVSAGDAHTVSGSA